MKKILVSLILAATFATSAFADCSDMYRKFKIKKVPATALSTTGGVALSGGGYVAFVIGAVVGMTASNQAVIVAGAALGLSATAGGVTVFLNGVKNGSQFISKARAYHLIKQAKAGSGDDVAELAEDFTEELGKEVTEAQVVNAILAGNDNNTFCADKNSIYGRKQLIEYIKLSL